MRHAGFEAVENRHHDVAAAPGNAARGDELLLDKSTLAKTYVLRRILAPMGTIDAIEFLLDKLRSAKNNADFFESMNT